jgi:hypothetical protein
MESALVIFVKTFELLIESREILNNIYAEGDNVIRYKEILRPIDFKLFASDDDFVRNGFSRLIDHFGATELLEKCRTMMSRENYEELANMLSEED